MNYINKKTQFNTKVVKNIEISVFVYTCSFISMAVKEYITQEEHIIDKNKIKSRLEKTGFNFAFFLQGKF